MSLAYVVRRIGFFFLTLWVAATLNFFLPRLGGGDPVRQQLVQKAAMGGSIQTGMEEMVKIYNEKFGLNRPLWRQYLTYLNDTAHFDFNQSMSNYPRPVLSIIGESIPWTLGMLLTTVIISWLIGSLLGAFMGWPRSPKFLQFLMPPLLSLNAIPYFLLGLVMVYLLGFRLGWFPMLYGYKPGTFPKWNLAFIKDVIYHALLPAFSIILVSIGGWALSMRAMMVTTTGEDYVVFADAKGLKDRTIFLRYAIRNALLPQTTALALVLGQVIAGTVLVEVVFSYPGIGKVLLSAIRGSDYFLVQGIVFVLVLAISLATLILDLIYPLLDPRITYTRS